jgi:hypothetical protein
MNRRKMIMGSVAFSIAVGDRQAKASDSKRTMDAWNGRAWGDWRLDQKSFWIEGFTSGYCWARVRVEELMDAFRPDKGTKAAIDILTVTDIPVGFTNARLVEEVDTVYSDAKNIELSVDLAAAHSFHRLNGKFSEKELREELAHFRAIVVVSTTMTEPRR